MKLKLHNVFFDCLHQIDIGVDCDERNRFSKILSSSVVFLVFDACAGRGLLRLLFS
mgnify:CR=1